MNIGDVVINVKNLFDELFSTEDNDGTQYHWNVTQGLKIAARRGDLLTISLSQMGATLERIRTQYDGMNEVYAMDTDLTKPLLFIQRDAGEQLVDGWHRVFKAAYLGVDELSAYVLTPEEGAECLIFTLPPGQGKDWGQCR